MKTPKTCPECRQKSMSLVTEQYRAEVKHDGRPYTVDLPALQFFRCANCSAVVLPDEADEAVGAELRRVAGLMAPDQIRDNRKQLGLTQKEFAELLGVAEATVCRWETGGQIQQHGYDRQMRTFFKFPAVRDFYQDLLEWPAAHPSEVPCSVVGMRIELSHTRCIWIDACNFPQDQIQIVEEVESWSGNAQFGERLPDWAPRDLPNRIAGYFSVGS